MKYWAWQGKLNQLNAVPRIGNCWNVCLVAVRGPGRLVERARMAPGCVAGVAVQQTARPARLVESPSSATRECHTRPNTVIKWRNQFVRLGLLGLSDRPCSGAKRKYNESFRNRVLEELELPPPLEPATWDGLSLAKEIGGSVYAVWRILRKRGYLPATAAFVVGQYRPAVRRQSGGHYGPVFGPSTERHRIVCG